MLDLLKTKTFWGGIASIATGVGAIVAGHVAEGATLIAQGFLAIFVRDGIRKAQTTANSK